MKASALFLIGVVVMLHVAAIGALVFIQGCGSTTRIAAPPPEPVMPPSTTDAVQYPPPAPPAPPPAAPVYREPEAAAVPAGTTEYVVRSGDSLGRIAKDYGVTVAELTALNRLANPNKLRAGQKILLPGEHTIKPPAPKRVASKPKPAAVAPVSESGSGVKVYVVQSGDSLSKIAKRHGVTIAALKQANNLSGDKLMIDQKLTIPSAGGEAAPIPTAEPPAQISEALPPESQAIPPVPVNEPIPVPTISATEETASVPTQDAVDAGMSVVHTVVANETLDSIAKLYAVTVDELMAVNGLQSRTVTPGQKLRMP